MKLQLTRFGLVTTALLFGCGGATSIDRDEYPDDDYGHGGGSWDSTNATGGVTSGGHTYSGPGSKGGSTGTLKTSSVGGSTGGLASSKGGSTGGYRSAKSSTTSWMTSGGGSARGGTSSRTTATSKGGVGNWSSTWASSGGKTNWTTNNPNYCMYGELIYSLGSTFTVEDGCTTCYCDYSGGLACTSNSCACVYFGMNFWFGENVAAIDGCNQCVCLEGGGISCTTSPCPSACTYTGRTYAQGDKFSAVDGCNTCTCKAGVVSCGTLDCACNAEKEYWRQYVAHSPNECASLKYRCQPGSTAFNNACGCGCEQSPDCPSYFDCSDQPFGGGGTSGTLPGYGGALAGGTSGAGSTYYPPGCPGSAELHVCPLSRINRPLL
jgi:hypothetical protein